MVVPSNKSMPPLTISLPTVDLCPGEGKTAESDQVHRVVHHQVGILPEIHQRLLELQEEPRRTKGESAIGYQWPQVCN